MGTCSACGRYTVANDKVPRMDEKVLTCVVELDDVTKQIGAAFDYAFDGTSRFRVPLLRDVPAEYGIGLIVGPSGSGKSSLLNEIGKPSAVSWSADRAIVSHFKDAGDAQERLAAVGLNSIPAWMRPFRVLSTGEQFRADLARRIDHGASVDEFTSVVDRQVAKSCAHALRRYVDERGIQRMTLASCHYDIIEWLRPDWYFDTATGVVTPRRGLQGRPTIELEILPCRSEAWALFRDHHYLSGDINRASRCWIVVWNDTAIGFTSSLAMPQIKNAWREHRTVVLPDFQGLGFGVRIADAIGEMFKRGQIRYFSKTAHPRMGQYRDRSSLWKPTTKNHMVRRDYLHDRKSKEDSHRLSHAHRWCFSHEYIGSA